MLIGMWAIFSWLPTWVQSLSSHSDAQHERGISMMLLGAGGLSGGFISGWVAHAIGLRRTMLLCFSVCFAMAFVLFKLNHSFSGLAYPEIAVLAVFFGISQGPCRRIFLNCSRRLFAQLLPVFVSMSGGCSPLPRYFLSERWSAYWVGMATLFLFFHLFF